MKGIIVGIVLLVVVSFAGSIFSSYKKETVTVKIEDVIQQQHYSRKENDGGSTKYRYLVITPNETFECQTSFWNMHFNKSDIFYHIKKDSTYTFVVCGFGKSVITDYRNILEIKK